MMATYAMVEKGIVVNTIEWDGVTSYNPGEQFIIVALPDDQGISIGWSWDDVNGFNPPQAAGSTGE